ncbi:MAG: hypothetical protein DRO14_03315 [Thermoprotei archaeon]|nr:MAG: hypothetical protein DRO14_03315 [Thermoprotei archaeon]
MLGASKKLIVGLVSTGMYFLAMQLVMSVLVRYSRDLGISLAGTSFIWSLPNLVAFILRPLAGYIADRTSSYLAMSLGSLFMMAASITYSTSSSFQELLIGRVLQGAGAAYFISPSIAAVATAASEKAGTALGVRSMLISLASIVAPPIAGVVVDSVGYLPVFAIAASLTGVLAVLNVLEAKQSIAARRAGAIPGAGWREALNKVVLMMMLAALFNGVLFLSLSGVLQAHYRDLGYEAKTYGYYLMFFGLSSTVSRYIAGKLSTQKNPAAIALVGHATAVLAVYMLKEMYLAPSSYIVALVYGFGMGLTVPTQQLIVTSSVPEEVRNRAISIYAMGYDLGGFIGPMVYGYIASAYGYNASYQYMVLIPLAALMLMAYLTLKVSRGR